MLVIENLSKTYKGGKRAVSNLSLEVRPGDIFGFIGHNGAGKTTTIRSIAGVLDFEEGDIRLDSLSIRKNPVEMKREMAYIPDNPDIYMNLTGIQYLNFIGDIFEVEKGEREARIRKYADLFELTPSLGDLISAYSHGMRQKLVLISAFLHRPKLIVVDEPFVGLDPKAAFHLKNMMAEHCAAGGLIFLSTHVLDTAEKICNKIAIIKEGKLIACGDTAAVRGDQSLEDVFLELVDDEA